MLLLWDDLPIPASPRRDQPLPARGAQLLKDHDVDEYFLEDEGEWTQDDSGVWIWRAADSALDLDCDEEDENESSDLDDFPLAAGPDLFSALPYSPAPSNNPQLRHYAPDATDSDQDWGYLEESRAETSTLEITTAPNSFGNSQTSYPLNNSQGVLEPASHLDHPMFDMDMQSDSGSELEIICESDNDSEARRALISDDEGISGSRTTGPVGLWGSDESFDICGD